MRAGQLNKRLTLQRQAAGLDSAGGASGEWESIATLWAKVEPIGGGENEQARQTVANATLRVTVRASQGLTITTADRLKHRSRFYFIGHVNDLESRGREIVLTCGEAV
jgi:SPP1 family predicted phage head-tail adaptor